MTASYDETYARSLADPDGFWGEAAKQIHWDRRWDRVLDQSREFFPRWFVGGVTNTCYNALDIHVERGRGDQVALIYDSPVTGTIRSITTAIFAMRSRASRALWHRSASLPAIA